MGGHVARQKKATSLDEIPVDRVVCNPTQEDELIAEEQAGELVEAVSLLTGRDQQLFALLRRDDLTSADIATRWESKLIQFAAVSTV